MSITVRIPTPLRKFTGDKASIEISGATVGEVLDNLEAQHEGIKERIMDDETGEVRRFVNVYVNEEDIRVLDGTGTVVNDGDQVTIIPAIAGGC